MALADVLERARKRYPDRVALLFGEERWTYGALNQVTDKLAGAMLAYGIQPGDRVAILLPNCPELVFCYYACFKIGAVAVPVNARLEGPEITYVLNHCGARMLIGDESLFKRVQEERPGLSSVEMYFIRGDASAFAGTSSLKDLLEVHPGITAFPELNGDDNAAILYTSGTTARPKGVLHNHRSFEETIVAMIEILRLSEHRDDDVFGIALPLYHTSGLMTMLLPAISTGKTALILPCFEPESVLESLARHRVAYFFALPFMYEAMIRRKRTHDCDLSSLRVAATGGDAVAADVCAAFKSQFGLELCETCGMTEVVPYSINPPYGRKKPGSIGVAAPGMELRLVDQDGHDVQRGCVGEILVRSKAAAVGYWNDDQATREALRDGWLRTGDLATVDRDGYYWFAGRKKEIIIRGGSNISPLEVEEAIAGHPAVKEVAVTGSPHCKLGEVVCAFIVAHASSALTDGEIRKFLEGRIAAYKIPESVLFLPELPRGMTGKIDRKSLRRMASAASPGN